jgi:hypothetical protein
MLLDDAAAIEPQRIGGEAWVSTGSPGGRFMRKLGGMVAK